MTTMGKGNVLDRQRCSHALSLCKFQRQLPPSIRCLTLSDGIYWSSDSLCFKMAGLAHHVVGRGAIAIVKVEWDRKERSKCIWDSKYPVKVSLLCSHSVVFACYYTKQKSLPWNRDLLQRALYGLHVIFFSSFAIKTTCAQKSTLYSPFSCLDKVFWRLQLESKQARRRRRV